MSTRSARRRRRLGPRPPECVVCGRLAAGRVTWRSFDGRYEFGGLWACVDHLRVSRWPASVQDAIAIEAEAINEELRQVCPICQGDHVGALVH